MQLGFLGPFLRFLFLGLGSCIGLELGSKAGSLRLLVASFWLALRLVVVGVCSF